MPCQKLQELQQQTLLAARVVPRPHPQQQPQPQDLALPAWEVIDD